MFAVDDWKPLAECETVGERVRALRGDDSHDDFAEKVGAGSRQVIIRWEKQGVGPVRRFREALASLNAARESGLTESDFEVPRAKVGRQAEREGWAESVEERLERMQAVLIRAGLVEDPLVGEDAQRRSEGGDTP